VGNEARDDPSKDFVAVNGIGTGHEVQNPASCLLKMMMMVM
jgi:hypothetical protein